MLISLPKSYFEKDNLNQIRQVLFKNDFNSVELAVMIGILSNRNQEEVMTTFRLSEKQFNQVKDQCWYKLMKIKKPHGLFDLEAISNKILSQVKNPDAFKQASFFDQN